MSNYEDDALDNAQEKSARDPIVGEGRTRIEIVEVTDRPGRSPESRGALIYRISGKVVSCVGPAAHYEGQRVVVLFTHGVGSPGYDPAKRTSYGDGDIKGFLTEIVKSTGTTPPATGWGVISRGSSGPAQTARGMLIDVVGYQKASAKDGKMYVRHRFEAVPGQASFASALLAGDSAPVTARPATPAAPAAPASFRPPGLPPAAEHPAAGQVREQASAWAAAGQSREAALASLLAWAIGLGLSDAQARTVIGSAF